MKKELITLLFLCTLTLSTFANDTLSIDPKDNLLSPRTGNPIKLPNIYNRTPLHIWISADRRDGKGKGTQVDPFDGHNSTALDNLLLSYSGIQNLHVHLMGPGPYFIKIAPTNGFIPASGWTIEGDGEDVTVLRAETAGFAGVHHDVEVIKTPYNVSTDNVTIKNLTIDANFMHIADKLDDGIGGARAVSDGVTVSGSATIKSATADFRWLDLKKTISGAGIPSGAATTIAADSNGASLPQSTINVASATGLPSSGIVNVGTSGGRQTVGYSGKTSTKLTGCVGGTGRMTTGSEVSVPTTRILRIPATTIATGSDGVAMSEVYTINTAPNGTADFTSSGSLYVESTGAAGRFNVVKYTGKTSSSFTECTGGSGSMVLGGAITTGSQIVTSANATASASSVALGIGGEKRIQVACIELVGSHNTVEHVRAVNFYGSAANSLHPAYGLEAHECFAISFFAPSGTRTIQSATNNHARFCRVESPYGSYSNGIVIAGTDAHHLMTNSSVEHCSAKGIEDGHGGQGGLGTTAGSGLTNGSTGGSFIKDCQFVDNTFVDAGTAFYCDTGSQENVIFAGNTAVRASGGIVLVQSGDRTWSSKKMTFTNNVIEVQNRVDGGGDALQLIRIAGVTPSDFVFNGNTFRVVAGGIGTGSGGHSLLAQGVANLILTNNTFDAPGYVFQYSGGTSGVYRFGNRDKSGGFLTTQDGALDTVSTFTYSQLPISPQEGVEFNITDSKTAAWGEAAAGSGANHVKVRWNGTAWTVIGK